MDDTHKKRGAAAYIFDNEGRVLLSQRGPKARHHAYLWEGPGGECEPGESFENAAKREIKEELGIDIVIDELLCEYDAIHDGHETIWEARIFKAHTLQSPAIQEPEKCVGFGWFDKDTLAQVALAPYCVEDFRRLGWV